MRVGLIGLGAIARGVLDLVQPSEDIRIVGVLVAHPNKQRAGPALRICRRVEDLIDLHPEVVVEAAGHAALRCYAPLILRSGIDLLLVSVGALADPATERSIVSAARGGKSHAIVASGAIGALDALAAASVGGLSRVTHTTRKPAAALLPNNEAEGLPEPREWSHGSAREGA